MSPLLGPILAQVVGLAVGDRSEARYIHSDLKYLEATTSPRVGLGFGWQHTSLSLGYGPSITITPLDSKPRDVLVNHSGSLSASYRWRRSSFSLSESVGYGKVNFQQQALAAGVQVPNNAGGQNSGTPGGTTTPPATGGTTGGTGTGTGTGTGASTATQAQSRAADRPLQFATSTTSLNWTQTLSANLSVATDVGYFYSSGVGNTAKADYPTTQGPRAQVSAAYRLTLRDSVTSSVAVQYVTSSTGNNTWIGLANESWGHALDKHTATSLGAGLSTARNSERNGTVAISIFPTFNSSINYNTLLARGTLGLGTGVSAAPALDPVRATVDPRLSVVAVAGWARDRFSSALAASSGLSLANSNSQGALSSVNSSLTLSYRLGAAVGIDGGVRGAYQRFEGKTTIPISWAAFFGISFGAALPLNGGL